MATDQQALTDRRSILAPLDQALSLLRSHGGRIVPAYLLAMLPFSLAMLAVIDAVSSRRRAALPIPCLCLALASLWRWLWLAWIQRGVQADIRGQPPLLLRRRWAQILYVRLVANFLLTWGGVLLVPPFFGWFLSGFTTPLLLEEEGPTLPRVRQALGWMVQSMGRLGQALVAMSLLWLFVAIAAILTQALLTSTVLTSILGLDTADLALTLQSGAWIMSLFYFLFLVGDLYWTVAAVTLFYDLQSRRLGSDLRRRLQQVAMAAQGAPGRAA